MENASTNDTTNILDTKDCLDQGEIDKYVSTFFCIRMTRRQTVGQYHPVSHLPLMFSNCRSILGATKKQPRRLSPKQAL